MGIINIVREAFFEGAKSFSKELEREISLVFLNRIDRIRRQMVKELIAVFIILIAIAFLCVSAVFFLTEYLQLTKTLAFLIMGAIVLFVGILVKLVN